MKHANQLAKYAPVCRDWQAYFATILLRKLTVQRDLVRLGKISPRRTELIQHLWLRIEFPPYECLACGKYEATDYRKNYLIFEKALRDLFLILHTWRERNPSHSRGGLTLEISVHSPTFLKLLHLYVPKNVKRLCLFEDFDEDFDIMYARDDLAGHIGTPSRVLGASLAALRNQQSLCVSFMVDAYDFFDGLRHRRHDRAWRELTHLSMTSMLLRPDTRHFRVQCLLMMAASAARRFPNLKIMELWYDRRQEACLFRFSRGLDGSGMFEIFRSGTWELPLTPGVVEEWTRVSELRRGQGLTVKDPERIDRQLIRSHGDAIHYLGLMSDAVHPISLRQIRREAQNYGPHRLWRSFLEPWLD
ncbi:hypothetical protein ACHAPT_012665 [Fusarium lateritium]